MRRASLTALLLLSFGLTAVRGPATAAELGLTEVPVEASVGVSPAESEVMQLQLEVEPRWDATLGDAGSAVLSFRLRLDGKDELEPGAPPFDNYDGPSKPLTLGDAGTLELRDVYYEHRLSSGLLRVGKQQIVWGRLDGVKILDVLNPQTFREFILDDLGDSRIGLWSAYLDYSVGAWRAELALIPDQTSHDIPEPGAWFELRAPRFRFGAPVDAAGLPRRSEGGSDWLEDGALGLRLSRFVGGVDVSGLYYSGQDHEPLGRVGLGEDGLFLEQYHRRREVLGLSAESSFGPVAWRAELSHQPGRRFNVRGAAGLDEVELDQSVLGVGADIQLPLNLLANVQLLWDRVHDAPAGLIRPNEDQLATVFLRRGFAYETLQTEFRWYHSLTDHDDTMALRASYAVNDELTLFASGEWFTGTPLGLFGQFARQDRVVLGFSRYF
jgi:hypothetical protein